MNRQSRKFWSLVLIASVLASGCAPQQPFYCREDGDLSHYLGVATEIEYPDTETSPSCEAADDDERRVLIIAALSQGRRVAVQSTGPIDELARRVWYGLPARVSWRRSGMRVWVIFLWAASQASSRCKG